MKSKNILKGMFVIGFTLILSTSLFAQEKPNAEKAKACCSDKVAKHVCTDECKTAGCDVVKAKEAKACTDVAKHVCTDECKTAGCDSLKAKEAKASTDKSTYECPMKCEPASDKSGKCSKCGMELKKVSKKS